MLELLHYKDSLMLSETVTCSAIELKYKGKFIGESKLSDDWYVGTGKNKIICICLTAGSQVSEIFEFQGSFTVLGIRIITQDLEEIIPSYKILDADIFSASGESFQNGGSYFSDYNSRHTPIKTIQDTDIYKNNLFTKQDEFYYENGDNYFGEYHQHSNGQAMTESKHNSDSVNIYRKDENNKLSKPKTKKLMTISTDETLIASIDVDKIYGTVKVGGSPGDAEGDTVGDTGGSGSGGSGGGY